MKKIENIVIEKVKLLEELYRMGFKLYNVKINIDFSELVERIIKLIKKGEVSKIEATINSFIKEKINKENLSEKTKELILNSKKWNKQCAKTIEFYNLNSRDNDYNYLLKEKEDDEVCL